MDIPSRTELGRNELIERKLLSDARLRSLLAQCDGKNDLDKLHARLGLLMDVSAGLSELRAQGLVAGLPAPAGTPAAPAPASSAAPAIATAARVAAPALQNPEPAAPAAKVAAKPEMAAQGSDEELSWFPRSWTETR
jgi:hypothetical protein